MTVETRNAWVGSTDWRETVPPGEDALFRSFGEEIRAMQAARAAKTGKMARALHVKPHVGVKAELTILDVPPQLRVGPFAEQRTYSAYVRFSNGSAFAQSDRRPDLRGVAVKLLDVPGKKLIPGLEDARTQDFLLIPTAALATGTPAEFMDLLRAGKAGPALVVPRLFWFCGFARAMKLLKVFGSMPTVKSVATCRFHSGAPIRFGDYAAKLDLVPVGEGSDGESKDPFGPDGVRADLISRLARGPIAYTLRAQLYVDAVSTPIEDASVLWPEAISPFIELARLTLPQQDVASPEGQELERLVEALSFDPWHAVETLRPLGAIMRSRAHAYRESVLARSAAPEP